MSLRRIGFLALGLLLSSGCGSSKDEPSGENGEGTCTPGRSVSCVGADSCEGFQICDDEGESYSTCECSDGSGGSSSGDGGSSSASGGDSSSSGGMGGESSLDCEPDESDFDPSDYVPARPAEDACSTEQVETYFADDCHLSSCEDFAPGGDAEDCGACLAPSEIGDESYGPLITVKIGLLTSFETNAAGCVELAGQLDCAEKIQAAQECAREACRGSCQPQNSDEYQDYVACQDDARDTVCADLEAETSCLNSDAADLCIGSDVFVTFGLAACASN